MSEISIPADIERALQLIDEGKYRPALEIIEPLAKKNDPYGVLNLALCYHLGFGVPVNLEKAIELYLSVGERNIVEGHLSALAYHNLATLFITGGRSITPDAVKAAQYENLARQLGFGMRR